MTNISMICVAISFSKYHFVDGNFFILRKVRTKGTVNTILQLLNDMQDNIATETEDAEKANAKLKIFFLNS